MAAYERREAGRRLRRHAPGRAPRDPLRGRPRLARAPLRDGPPARRHRPARGRPARPAGGVPARGLRGVQRDAGPHQGRGDRLLLQPAGAEGRRRPGPRRAAGAARRQGRGAQGLGRQRREAQGPPAVAVVGGRTADGAPAQLHLVDVRWRQLQRQGRGRGGRPRRRAHRQPAACRSTAGGRRQPAGAKAPPAKACGRQGRATGGRVGAPGRRAGGQDPGHGAQRPDKVGRNDPCPCGSGQKYKRCHGA